jgi:hypothetical protein
LGFTDNAVSVMMVEGIVPTVFHQDPRYFRKGTGSGWSRVGYAMGRLWVAPSDRGHMMFNTAEIFGNAATAGLGNLYYPSAERGLGKTGVRFATGLGTDMLGNIMREFWPDIDRWMSNRRAAKKTKSLAPPAAPSQK